jgi:K+-sensing histidine kinase KdpD
MIIRRRRLVAGGVRQMASNWLARHRSVVWAAAVFLGPLVAGLLTLARAQLHENQVTLILVLTVACVSAAGLRPAGLVAALTTAIAYDYFWTEPFFSFAIVNADDILTVLLLVIVGGAIEQLSWWGGRQKAVADQRLDYFTALRRAAAPIPTEAPAPTLDAMSNTVRTVLDADSCQLVVDEPLPATVLHGDGSITRAGRVIDVARLGLPTDDIIAIPIPCSSRSAYFAVIAASHIARPPTEQRQVAALLAHLAAEAVELQIAAPNLSQPATGTDEGRSALS